MGERASGPSLVLGVWLKIFLMVLDESVDGFHRCLSVYDAPYFNVRTEVLYFTPRHCVVVAPQPRLIE
jgi:hypothetical protein